MGDKKYIERYLKINFSDDLRLVADKDLKPSILNTYVRPNRKTNPNYGLIIKGDFDGNGTTDYAAKVVDKEGKPKLIVIYYDETSDFFDCDGDQIIFLEKRRILVGRLGEVKGKKILMRGEGIQENNPESKYGGTIVFWDGNKLQSVWGPAYD
jgi:hypothetical protein